jgi:hypothetical protein
MEIRYGTRMESVWKAAIRLAIRFDASGRLMAGTSAGAGQVLYS